MPTGSSRIIELIRYGKWAMKDMVMPPPREKATMENPEDDAPVHDRVDEAAAKRICMPKSLES